MIYHHLETASGEEEGLPPPTEWAEQGLTEKWYLVHHYNYQNK
jgi:hypothetical protein